MELKSAEYTEDKTLDLEDQLDPDHLFLSSNNINCNYYFEDDYNNTVKSEGKFSIIHFNSRSMYANFNAIKEYLHILCSHLVLLRFLRHGLMTTRMLILS